MAKEKLQNLQLGLFIVIGSLLLITALYLVGNKRNLFGSTLSISARFQNVNGLMPGNNVRFAGIDVGTVESIEIVSDSSVNVVMVIDEKVKDFIRKNAQASVGTDGLMGNKLVNINSAGSSAPCIEQGDVLQTLAPIETDEMVRTLNETNKNMKGITANLLSITERFDRKNSLWTLLMDTAVAGNIRSAAVNINVAGRQTAIVTGNLRDLTSGIKNGRGTLGALVTDTSLSSKIRQVVVKLELLSDTAAIISGDIHHITSGLKDGKGSAGVLLSDTSFVHNLNQSISQLQQGAKGFSENMEALKHSFLLRKYFRKKKT